MVQIGRETGKGVPWTEEEKVAFCQLNEQVAGTARSLLHIF